MLEGHTYRNMDLLAVDCKLPPLVSTETTSFVEILKLPPNQCFVLLQTYLNKTKPPVPDSLTYSRVKPERLPKLIATNATALTKALHDNDPSPPGSHPLPPRPSPKPPQQPRPSPKPR